VQVPDLSAFDRAAVEAAHRCPQCRATGVNRATALGWSCGVNPMAAGFVGREDDICDEVVA